MKKSKLAASAAAALCCASLLTAVPSAIPKADATRISYQGLTFSSGDLNFDGRINACDLILARRGLIDAFTGIPFKDHARFLAADVDGNNQFTMADFVQLQEFVLGKRSEFELAPNDNPPGPAPKPTITGSEYMNKCAPELTENYPQDVLNKAYGVKVEKKYYTCKFNNQTKPVNIVLPENYDPNKKYPVLYALHGIGGNEDNMIGDDMGVVNIAANLAKSGQAKEMIIVSPQMFTHKTKQYYDNQINADNTAAYDNFLYDLTESLMPFIEENYPVLTGRENTAISGFSMGGREAIYIGLMRSDLFGYIGGACPAPGIYPTSDLFMGQHPGSVPSESDFKFKDGNPLPYMFLISGAQGDFVVSDHPERYHNTLTANKVDHLWQVITVGNHDGNSVKAHMYNFLRWAFNAE